MDRIFITVRHYGLPVKSKAVSGASPLRNPNRSWLFLLLVLMPSLASSFAEEASAKPVFYDLHGKQVSGGAEVTPAGRIEHVTNPVVRLLPTSHPSPRGWFMLFPGGGYIRLSAVKEGTQTAAFLNEQGYHVAMLEYRVNQGRETRELALQDALAAWRMVMEKAGDFGFICPVGKTLSGMIGYSAGGHLAARATMHLPVLG